MTFLQIAQIADIWLIFVAMGCYQLQLQFRSRGRARYVEGLPKLMQAATGIPALAVLAAFLLDPDLPAARPFSLTADIDLAGLLLFNLAAVLIFWSHVTLGDHWSGDLETKPDHRLVEQGLYQFVRHPLYTSYLLLTLGLYLLSDNGWLGAMLLAYFCAVASRVWKEEAMMRERLGETYLRYQQRTGRFLPRLSVLWPSAEASRRFATAPTDPTQ